MELMTNSRLKVARACQRKHRLMYVEGWRAVSEALVLRFGTLVHKGLEAWWGASGDRLDAALAAVQGEADPFDRVRAEELLRGYHFRWIDEPLTVVAVEREFVCDLINPETGAASRTFQTAGKLDVVARDSLGDMIVEHKTSSEDISPGSEYWKRLRMDGQVSTYYRGAQSLGYDVRGCLYDVIGKPGIRPLKATPVENRKYTKEGKLYANLRAEDETPEEFRIRLRESIAESPDRYYQRGMVVRLESEQKEALADTWAITKGLREAELAGRAPRNPDACVMYGRTCEFLDVCSGAETLEHNSRFVKLNVVHPELSGTVPAETGDAQSPKE